ncbi:PREDICTED: uncharacterized protein LOC105359955 [Ceratosolen solmsi marchali]|uniref:Uncharacterized protein LOC105359955 n=1 Tax=Ceratosolen solmsi marchali TaxID=326594 RepID=A0AAJ6YCC8_9HYME|nr:PREDICTED: uncharacterized protein LOC105359955 [Ceratosolen solmsi marchali]
MKFPVILIAAAMAVGASRPPQMLNPRYYDSSPYVETPPSSIRSSLRSPSYLSHEPFLRNSESISIKDDIPSDGPPYDYREERNFFDFPPPASSYLSSHKPPSFYQDRLSSFREDKFNAQDYKGPPPPVPKQEILKQMHYMQNDRLNNSSKMQVMKFQKEQASSQSTTTEHNQPLLSNQRANINHGTRGLGFASVIGVTSSDINPVALADSSSTTKAATAMHSTLSLHSPSTNEVHVSLQDHEEKHHAVTNALSTEILTAGAASTPLPKNPIESPYTQTSTNIGVTLNDIASTTPAAITKMTSLKPDSNLDPFQNPSSQPLDSTMIFHEPPKVSSDFRTASQEFPMATHEKQSIESPRQNIHVPHVKQNFFLSETKSNIPFQPSHLQIHEKHHNNDYVAPLRFSIPTASTPTSLSISTTPMKLVYQSLDFSRSAIPLIAGSHSQAYTPQQNQVDVTQFEKLNSANNLDSNANTYAPQHSQLDLTNFGKLKPGNNLGR